MNDMIKRFVYLLSALIAVASCSDMADRPEYHYDDAEYINFGAPELTVESRAPEEALPSGVKKGSTLLLEIAPNTSFGVIGYCRAKYPGTNNETDNSSGNSPWSSKVDNVFPEIFLNQEVKFDGNVCTYSYGSSGAPRKWLSNTDAGGIETSDFKYTFFSYYPFNRFNIENPTSLASRGAPRIKYSMPFISNDQNAILEQATIPDVMLDAKYNFMRYDGKVAFNYSHVLTALSFTVNNYSGIPGEGGLVEGQRLVVKKIELKGKFWRTVKVDFSSSIVGLDFPDDETYQGTFVIYDNPAGMEIPYNDVNFKPAFADQYILLISGKHVERGMSYLGDVKVRIEYEFDGIPGYYEEGRPGTFVPTPGTMYQAQLNFVGDAFVLQFVDANNEVWGDGSDTDITFE